MGHDESFNLLPARCDDKASVEFLMQFSSLSG
jgi:hypothetical protein